MAPSKIPVRKLVTLPVCQACQQRGVALGAPEASHEVASGGRVIGGGAHGGENGAGGGIGVLAKQFHKPLGIAPRQCPQVGRAIEGTKEERAEGLMLLQDGSQAQCFIQHVHKPSLGLFVIDDQRP
jgi:hypothetical protein